MSTIFQRLGIFGMPEKQEDALLASLLIGDPTLLIGKQGTAKTGLVTAIGAAMSQSTQRKYPDEPDKWIKYHAYDSSKINFEDLIGIPNVQKFQDGKMEYVTSPQTAWDKHIVCFDEFNRQLPERQNNLFELIRSRTLMGSDTKTLWIFNCMNPYGMAGTEVLDDALVDRHMWFIYVTDFHGLDEASKLAVANHTGHHDAVAIKRYWGNREYDYDIKENVINHKLADVGDDIFKLMEVATVCYHDMLDEIGEAYGHFVSRFISTLQSEMHNKDWHVELTGRRASMLRRGLIAYRAVQLAKAKEFGTRVADPRTSAKNALLMSIPVGIAQASANGMDHTAITAIKTTVDTLSEFFNRDSKASMIAAIDTIYELFTTPSLARKIEILTQEMKDEFAQNQAWNDIVTPKTMPKPGTNEALQRSLLLWVISNLITVDPKSVPINYQKHVVREALTTKVTDLTPKLELKGALALHSDQIESHIAQYTDDCVRMQAVLTYQAELASRQMLSRSELSMIRGIVDQECLALRHIIDRGKFISNPVSKTKAKTKDSDLAVADQII